jgi:hypothetical protein
MNLNLLEVQVCWEPIFRESWTRVFIGTDTKISSLCSFSSILYLHTFIFIILFIFKIGFIKEIDNISIL